MSHWISPDGVDTRFMTPTQLEIGGRLAFANDRLKSFAPVIIGAWMDAVCLGILSALLVRWWCDARPNEGRWNRYLVYWEYLTAGLATSAYVQGYAMAHFSRSFGEYRHFLSVSWVRWAGFHWTFARMPAACFFLHRAYRLCNRSIWPLVIWVPMLVVIAALTITTIPLIDRLPYPPLVRNLALATISLEMVQDITLTLTIAVQLYRSKTGWKKTDKIIHKLLLYLAHSQAPITIVNIAMWLSFLVWPNSTGQLLLLFQPKTFGICILVVLLTRVKMREGEQSSSSSNAHSRSIKSFFTSSKSSKSKGSSAGSRTLIDGQTSMSGQESKLTNHVLSRRFGDGDGNEEEIEMEAMASAANLIDSKPKAHGT